MLNHLLWIFFFSVILLIHGCAKQKVIIDKTPSPAGSGVYHVVERHQTLFRICKTYGVDIHDVAGINRITDHGRIQAGQKIFIPGAQRVLNVDVYIDDVVSEPAEKEKTVSCKLDFIWPVEGKLNHGFDETESRRHMGIDISAPVGTPFKASHAGKVIYSGDTVRGYGNLIILRHSEEFVTIYAHNQVNLVEEGVWVEKGQVIGKVGQTGRTSGPHLHFEIREKNRAVDPLSFLK